ncbi:MULTISPECIES: phage tail protein I [unclassified Roseibium]|uniref:phage tail protein I n=1 Tax=unclassified Roseibium TaxID=2629323 RepID=UPI00273EC422|nr:MULTISPECIES: phage tail protein I [unclassified Roseibium]
MEDFLEILPDSTAPAERALAKAVGDDLPVPLAEQMNAYTADAANLPHLAAHVSVDYWYDDWPEQRKREVVAHYGGYYASHTGEWLSELKGTRIGTIRFLAHADGLLLDTISYPQKVVLGRSLIRRAPIGHPPFAARHLVKVLTSKPPRAAVCGRGVIARSPVKTPDYTPIERTRIAMKTAKAPHSEYRVDWAHKRVIRIDDQISIDGGFKLGQYIDRTRL